MPLSGPRRRAAWLAGLLLLAAAVGTIAYLRAKPGVDPASVRAAARAAGLGSLATVRVPTPDNLFDFVRDTVDGGVALRQLGKALFWDMQLGADGQACASCHFHAGADNRAKNQLNPGVNSRDAVFGNAGLRIAERPGHSSFGPNHALVASDFPFHAVDPCGPLDFLQRKVLRDTNDIVSSQGVFATGVDPIFKVGSANMRRTAPRNAPSVINAVFNVDNFWDGRAKGDFNGASFRGPLDADAAVFEDTGTALVARKVRINYASLASQSLDPPLSDTEMSFERRTFAQIGRKMLPLRPLDLQLVSRDDSVLGSLSRGQKGLDTRYDALVRRAFQPRWWASTAKTGEFTQMEANFSLYFGLAIQAYESLLVSDRSAFDRFMEGDDAALTQEQLRGLLAFIKTPFSRGKRFRAPFSGADVFEGIGKASCVTCHSGPELTSAAHTTIDKRGSIALAGTIQSVDGKLMLQNTVRAHVDQGFFNIGVRPTEEDLGRGAQLQPPPSFTRTAVAGMPFAPPLPACGQAAQPCPFDQRDLVNGAFKVPGLRNVELTGPYFHNGGQATLRQVLDFYRRQGDFGDLNVADISPSLALVAFTATDADSIVQFLLSLTDERVRQEQAPFDHPQLFVPNGSPGNSLRLTCPHGAARCESQEEIPAVGAGGRPAAGLPPLRPFLQLDPLAHSSPRQCP